MRKMSIVEKDNKLKVRLFNRRLWGERERGTRNPYF